MLKDLIIGIIASLIASIITGFLGNKAISKSNSIMLKVYVLFLAASVFVTGAVLSVILNEQFKERLATFSEVNLLKFYHNCINSFVFIIAIIALVSLIVLGIEAYHRGAKREHKADMDRFEQLR